MKLAFYEAFQPNATWIDVVIAIATLGTKSHVEGVFSDGVWFSISGREKDGARFKIIEPKEGSWTFVDIPVGIEVEERLRSLCLEKIGIQYSYIGAVLSATPFCYSYGNKDFCSRLWANLLFEVGYPLDSGCKYTPEELYDAVININLVRVSNDS